MAHFGKVRDRPSQTLWGSVAAGGSNGQSPFYDGHGNVVPKDVDRFLVDPSRKSAYLKKWQVAGDPIKQEHSRSRIEAPFNVKEIETARKYEDARKDALKLVGAQQAAALNAIAAAEKQDLHKKINAEIDEAIASDFRNWIAGRGKPEDYAKADLWDTDSRGRPVNKPPAWLDGQPISRHTSVINYIDKLVDNNMSYEQSLAQLRAKMSACGPRNMSLPELWTYYKYVIKGMDPAKIVDDDYLRYYSQDPDNVVMTTPDQPQALPTPLDQAKSRLSIVGADGGDASVQHRNVAYWRQNAGAAGRVVPQTAFVNQVGVNVPTRPVVGAAQNVGAPVDPSLTDVDPDEPKADVQSAAYVDNPNLNDSILMPVSTPVPSPSAPPLVITSPVLGTPTATYIPSPQPINLPATPSTPSMSPSGPNVSEQSPDVSQGGKPDSASIPPPDSQSSLEAAPVTDVRTPQKTPPNQSDDEFLMERYKIEAKGLLMRYQQQGALSPEARQNARELTRILKGRSPKAAPKYKAPSPPKSRISNKEISDDYTDLNSAAKASRQRRSTRHE